MTFLVLVLLGALALAFWIGANHRDDRERALDDHEQMRALSRLLAERPSGDGA